MVWGCPERQTDMFLGEYEVQFTGHGRIVLPKKFRQELGKTEEVVLSRGFEGCIWGFSKEEFEKESGKQLEVPVTDKKGRDLRRYLFSAAESAVLDYQGRFVIPRLLLEYANLKESRVVIIGAGDHFEIWNIESWKREIKKLTSKKYGNY
ncbi:MAG: division/cell wall cluster transcriptional repressor MraZ [Armatimonadetes bacterium]|nr:MAG: division/cell wall cluster transcriptional repressor MraZ [Armatimonadota bacterium]